MLNHLSLLSVTSLLHPPSQCTFLMALQIGKSKQACRTCPGGSSDYRERKGVGAGQQQQREKYEVMQLSESRDFYPQSAWREINKVKITIKRSLFFHVSNSPKRTWVGETIWTENNFSVCHPCLFKLSVFAHGEKNDPTDLFKFKLLLAVDAMSPLTYRLSGM